MKPGRIIVSAAFAAQMFMPAVAGESVDESLSASASGTVEIINTRGTIKIEGWDNNEIHVEGELDDLAEELIFKVDGDHALIEVRLPKHHINWGDGSDLYIKVPDKSRVSFEGVSTDAMIRSIGGGIKIRSVSGDVTAAGISEQINVKTVSGDIDIQDSSGKANVSTVSGEIELDIDSSNLMVDTVSGDIEATLESFARLRANGVSGDIEIEGTLLDDGEIDISSVSSDVRLELGSPLNATIFAATGPGGDITNYVNDDKVETKFPAMNSLRTRVGDGSGRINLRTVSGDIYIDND